MNILAVHGGACLKKCDEMLKICAISVEQSTVLNAVRILENNDLFNCGHGSNLTIDGKVECEASYMSSENLKFGAVGCVSRFQNPSEIAQCLANDDWWNCRNLLHPLVLVGEGAEKYSERQGFKKIEMNQLISKKSQDQFEKCQKHLDDVENVFKSFDTVGAVSLNSHLESEAITSSGGIIMKTSGRLGHSCIYGSGNWAESRLFPDKTQKSLSICSTGHGEALIRLDFCRSIARKILEDDDNKMYAEIIRDFLNSTISSNKSIIFGAILLISERIENKINSELIIFHNCPFLPVAVRHPTGKIQKFISKLKTGADFCIKSISINKN